MKMETVMYVMAQGKVDYELEVIRVYTKQSGDMMTIVTEEGAIYVTKEQAMKFWGLVEKS